MNTNEIKALKGAALAAKARELDIAGRSKMTADELRAAIAAKVQIARTVERAAIAEKVQIASSRIVERAKSYRAQRGLTGRGLEHLTPRQIRRIDKKARRGAALLAAAS